MHISSYVPLSGFVLNIHQYFKIQNKIDRLKHDLRIYQQPVDSKIMRAYSATRKMLDEAYEQKFEVRERVMRALLTTMGAISTTATLCYFFRKYQF